MFSFSIILDSNRGASTRISGLYRLLLISRRISHLSCASTYRCMITQITRAFQCFRNFFGTLRERSGTNSEYPLQPAPRPLCPFRPGPLRVRRHRFCAIFYDKKPEQQNHPPFRFGLFTSAKAAVSFYMFVSSSWAMHSMPSAASAAAAASRFFTWKIM